MTLNRRKITDYKPAQVNPNAGSERGVSIIEDSLHHNGAGRSLLADAHGEMIAGSHTLEALVNAGFTDVLEVEIDGTTPVVVKRKDLDMSDPRARALQIADNRATQLGYVEDVEVLAALLGDIQAKDTEALKGTGYSQSEIQALLDSLPSEQADFDAPAQLDRAAELQEKWQVKRGDLWSIGNHRLLCGDSTNADDVARLMDNLLADCMWTDPPYGVEYVGKTADALTIQNDGAANLPELLANAFSCADGILRAGASIYIAHPPGVLCVTFGNAFIKAGWHFHETLIWVKNSMVLGHSDYHFKHEPLIYGWKAGDHDWYGGRDKVSVFEVDKPQRNGEHPTMKPVELIITHLQNSTARNNRVYDPFGGSGTTMVACEQLARQCRMIEISEKYCAVILERMANLGLTPQRISENE